MASAPQFRVAELFAGVGGFRLGLERAGWSVVWSNQWEPSTKTQHASQCYVSHFGAAGHVCDDIVEVLRDVGAKDLPDFELLVGGFPCQDYSVAKSLPQATGIHGKKGVLWWSIYDMLALKKPPFVLLENVDRMLKSPASQRGRDFAVILSCLSELGYSVEWRVVNAADYGFPQRRRRVFLYAVHHGECASGWRPIHRIYLDGVMAKSLPIKRRGAKDELKAEKEGRIDPDFTLYPGPFEVSERFGRGLRTSPFLSAGVMIGGMVWTRAVERRKCRRERTLGDVVSKTKDVPQNFFVPEDQVERWEYLKGPKSEPRVDKKTGHEYFYSEGGMRCPDDLESPARTILTGEGGSSPSRFKHIIWDPAAERLRRLTPEELEELNGFKRGWTDTGMGDGRRAFMMGNALVVGIVSRIGRAIKTEAETHLTQRAEGHAGEAGTDT